MEFPKLNLFKKLNDTMPIGLAALGLQKSNLKKSAKKRKKTGVYPSFFKFDKITPVAL